MFLVLSKVLDWFAEPLAWVQLLALGALVAAARRRRGGAAALGGAALAVLVTFSLPAVANALQRRAEAPARDTSRPGLVYDAAIVLGGASEPSAERLSGELELNDAVDRYVRGFELARTGRARYLLLSAGLIRPERGEPSEADRVAAKLVAWGIPRERIVAEGHSRNTRENAVESERVVRARGWRTLLLVTSAAHMPRALGCFRAVGLEPDALPVDRRARDGSDDGWLPRASALARSTEVLHELTGRVVYRLVGYAR
ncbi:YdcF family protein [Anaeromyxobacter paludicola]|uniref:DUF218 domain-containing protein n=1 Tax=Anaeromyxobacter paludicola TaxID=2918171 RepID=A0ABM7X6A5_9BACT|nr:YdcF family protein [Anaeromyxobacter paludicola]BDG07344.1 hypothetical protein AMPC_04570 [Anaeromyxobacter paludicola]